MTDSLSDRTFESFRRVAPERRVSNRQGDGQHREEYAQAVVGIDLGGSPQPLAGPNVGQLLQQLVFLQQETNLLLLTMAAQMGAAIPSPDSLPETLSTPTVGTLAA